MSASEESSSSSSSSSKEETPTIPSVSSIRDGIYQGVKATVSGANSVLASLQSTSEGIRKPVTSALKETEHQGTKMLSHCRVFYERRHEFGPYYVAGATLGVGGITALRRGRIPGVLLGVLAGGATYVSLYEPLVETPVLEWPFKNLTGHLGGSSDKKE